MPSTWTSGPNGPDTVAALRQHMEQLARAKKGKDLIHEKFVRDHIYTGHGGGVQKIAATLAKRCPTTSLSTFVQSDMTQQSQADVLNWKKKIADTHFTYAAGTWTIANRDSAITAVNSYSYATADIAMRDKMDRDDVVAKSRKISDPVHGDAKNRLLLQR